MRVIFQQTRSQVENKELAVEQFIELLRDAVKQVPDTAIFAFAAHGPPTPSFTIVDKLLQRGTIFVRTAGCGRRTTWIDGTFPPWPAAERYRVSALNSTGFCLGPGRYPFSPPVHPLPFCSWHPSCCSARVG